MTFPRSQALRSAFLAMLIAIMFSGAALASGPTEFLVYGFPTKVGCPTPSGNLAVDAAGNLYGTTCIGGTGHGTVYELMAPVPPQHRVDSGRPLYLHWRRRRRGTVSWARF